MTVGRGRVHAAGSASSALGSGAPLAVSNARSRHGYCCACPVHIRDLASRVHPDCTDISERAGANRQGRAVSTAPIPAGIPVTIARADTDRLAVAHCTPKPRILATNDLQGVEVINVALPPRDEPLALAYASRDRQRATHPFPPGDLCQRRAWPCASALRPNVGSLRPNIGPNVCR